MTADSITAGGDFPAGFCFRIPTGGGRVRRFVVLALLLTLLGALFGEIVVVEECGMTRQEARDRAMRTALEQVNGAFITSRTKVEDFQAIEDIVYSRVKGFVRIVEVLKEWQEDDGYGNLLHCVRAKVEVQKQKVEERISQLMESVGNPTIVVITVENYVNRDYTSRCRIGSSFGFFEKFGFKGFLKDRGLEVQEISADLVDRIKYEISREGFSPRVVDELVSDAKDIASYVVAVKADGYGTYVPDYDVCSVKLETLVKIIRTDTRKTIDLSYSGKIAKYLPMNAVEWLLRNPRSETNLEKIADDIAQRIYMDRVEYAFNPKNVRVRLILPRLDIASKVEELIRGLPEVQNVSKQLSRGNELVLAVQTYRTPERLWDLMHETLKGDIDMELVDLGGDTIVVKVNQLMTGGGEVVLKFKIDRLSTGVKIKKCLMNLEGVKFLGTVGRSKEMYEFKIETDMDVEDLMVSVEEMNCSGVEITAEDVADDGSWILFSARRR